MMREIINHCDALDLAANFQPPAHTFETGERASNRLARNAPGIGRNDYRQTVAHVEFANQGRAELSPIAAFTRDREMRHAVCEPDVSRLPFRIIAGAERLEIRKQPLAK